MRLRSQVKGPRNGGDAGDAGSSTQHSTAINQPTTNITGDALQQGPSHMSPGVARNTTQGDIVIAFPKGRDGIPITRRSSSFPPVDEPKNVDGDESSDSRDKTQKVDSEKKSKAKSAVGNKKKTDKNAKRPTRGQTDRPRGISGVPLPRPQGETPLDPTDKINWGTVTTSEEMAAFLQEEKALLLAYLTYWGNKASQMTEQLKVQELSEQANWKNNWADLTDVQTGEIWDDRTRKKMTGSVARYQKDRRKLQQKVINSAFVNSIKAQALYEDFLYYQVEWNRRFAPARRDDDHNVAAWFQRLISLYNTWHVGSRQNVPRLLGPEDVHRYPDDLRNTTKQKERKRHLEGRFPRSQQVMNEHGIHLSLVKLPGIDHEAIETKQKEVNDIREKQTGHMIQPAKVYHASTEKTNPVRWFNDESSSIQRFRTCFETNQVHRDWGPGIVNGEWKITRRSISEKPRFQMREVRRPQLRYHYVLDEHKARIWNEETDDWKLNETPVVEYITKEVFRLDKSGQRIKSNEPHLDLSTRFITSRERHKYYNIRGRRERAEEGQYEGDFSDEEEDGDQVQLYTTLNSAKDDGNFDNPENQSNQQGHDSTAKKTSSKRKDVKKNENTSEGKKKPKRKKKNW